MTLIVLLSAITLVVGVCLVALGRHPPAGHVRARARDVIVQLFEWQWSDIATECRDVLGPDGYAAVQISPPQEAVVRAGSGHPWWEAYQPVSYGLTSRFGTEAALRSMISTCHAAGVRVYVDAVLNHMTGQHGGVGDAGTTFPGKYHYPGLYSDADFHGCHTPIQNWGDKEQVWNCEFDGLADLNTGSTRVRRVEAAYLNSLLALGADGFRIDAARNISPSDIAGIESLLTRKVFIYQEVKAVTGEPVAPSLYQGTGYVQEFRFGAGLRSFFEDGRLAQLRGFGTVGMERDDNAVAFVDDQDTERDGSALSYRSGSDYVLANIVMLAWNYGIPEVLSDYRFTGYDQGPPGAGGNTIAHVNCGHDWECEQRWPAVSGMIGWHNAAIGQPITHWWTNGGNAIAFGRGARAFVAINKEPAPVTRTFDTGLPAGRYCDVVRGRRTGASCPCPVITVDSAGQARITVAARDAVGIDVNAMAPAH